MKRRILMNSLRGLLLFLANKETSNAEASKLYSMTEDHLSAIVYYTELYKRFNTSSLHFRSRYPYLHSLMS